MKYDKNQTIKEYSELMKIRGEIESRNHEAGKKVIQLRKEPTAQDIINSCEVKE